MLRYSVFVTKPAPTKGTSPLNPEEPFYDQEKKVEKREMSKRERLEAAFALEETDRTPILGGWLACPEHIMEIVGISADEYWADPAGVSIRAYEILGMDGLIGNFVPRNQDDFRCVDHTSYAMAEREASLEQAVAEIDNMPTPEEIEANFNLDAAYEGFRHGLLGGQERCGDMLWMPAQWGAGARISWYGQFGYQNFFCIIGLYHNQARKLMEVGGAQGRCQSRLVARAVEEGIYPRAILLGEDICNTRGPMISPDFMEKYYAPQLRYGLEPLLEAGCRPVWHSDGNVLPMLDFLIDAGVQGLQGFQPECGMVLDELIERKTRDGENLLIFGPLAVTTELPVCTPEEITAKVHHAINICRGKASLALFTANTINPDVPLENIRAMYEAVYTV